jgi:hypothetical protein
MGQILRKEIVGLIQKTGSTVVTLAPSLLNIGGQQYSIPTNLLVNLSSVGFGGLDAGSIAASTTYHVYAVVNNTGAIGLVASLNLPTAGGPTGFPTSRYVWSVHTDQSSIILDFQRVGKKNVFTETQHGVTVVPDPTANNAALLIDSSGVGGVWPFSATPSNNMTFTNNMLAGLADEFKGRFFFLSDGGNSNYFILLREVGGLQRNIVDMSSIVQSIGKWDQSEYTGTVGDNYEIDLGASPATFTTRILANMILSYENKIVDESSSAGSIVQNGTVLSGPINELWLKGPNGYGSTNLYQRRWSTVAVNLGTAFTYNDSPTLGTTITINEDGLYAFTFTEQTNSNSQYGVTVNQTNPALPISGILGTLEVLATDYTGANNLFTTTTGIKFLHAGDILRTLSDAAAPGTNPQLVGFRIEKIALSGVTGTQFVGPRSEVYVYGGNGHGSVDTFIRRFTTLVSSSGTDITFTDNATNGSFFTINTTGLYCIAYQDASSSGADAGVTRNSPNLTTAVADPSNDPYRLFGVSVSGAGANQAGGMSVTIFCNAGDIIRAHNDSSSTPNGTANNGTAMRITKVSN